MNTLGTYTCPSCGEAIDVRIDPTGGMHQEYVEDCPVCCRPNVLRITVGVDEGDVHIEARGE
jgi:ribosomal protein L37AE/L43A